MNEKKISTSTIAMIALMTAVTCILGSNFPDKSCNLFYRNIAWMEKRNGVLCDLFIDRLSWSSGVFKFFGGPSKVIWTDRWLSDRIYFSGNDQWLVY